jgi:hypothetical protein
MHPAGFPSAAAAARFIQLNIFLFLDGELHA